MKTTFDAYRLLFTPLSPIHIGAGMTYEPTNYVIEGDALHEFDTAAVVDALSAQDHQELNSIVSRTPDDTMLRLVQKFFHDRRGLLAPRAVHRIPVQAGVAQLYQARVGQIAQQEARGRRIINQLEIGRTAYNVVSRLPVLLGSSVKGAIRTALLDYRNNDRPTPEKEGLHPFQGKAELFRYYEGRLFPERDPMRLVHLYDSSWQGEPGLPATEVIFAINRKKAPAEDRQGRQRGIRADSGPPQILECVPALRYRAFAGQLNVQLLGDVNKPGQIPSTDLRFDMQRIAEACNRFYLPIFRRELDLLSTRGWLDGQWAGAVADLVDAPMVKDGNAFLLRVGRHCGAQSVTLNGVRKIKILQGRERRPREESAATTVWLAAKERDQESSLLPFGWMLVEFAPVGSADAGENSMMKALCEQRLGTARQWADRLKAKESEWERERQAAVAARRANASQAGHGPTTQPRSRWVDDKIRELCTKPGIKPDDALRGRALAEAVRAIDDETTRREALADIVHRWKEKGWWEGKLSGSAKQAKAMYDGLLGQPPEG